ncbi:MAG TPA: hypothetical protein VNZ86_03135 [Bacteroidia bacterium]|nr:hypothetical protein [Bacteroidia bacterium]
MLSEPLNSRFRQAPAYGNDYPILNYLSVLLILVCAAVAIRVIYLRKPKPDPEEVRFRHKEHNKHSDS